MPGVHFYLFCSFCRREKQCCFSTSSEPLQDLLNAGPVRVYEAIAKTQRLSRKAVYYVSNRDTVACKQTTSIQAVATRTQQSCYCRRFVCSCRCSCSGGRKPA